MIFVSLCLTYSIQYEKYHETNYRVWSVFKEEGEQENHHETEVRVCFQPLLALIFENLMLGNPPHPCIVFKSCNPSFIRRKSINALLGVVVAFWGFPWKKGESGWAVENHKEKWERFRCTRRLCSCLRGCLTLFQCLATIRILTSSLNPRGLCF